MSEAHRYRVIPANPGGHLVDVELTVAEPNPDGQAFAMPAWIPGSYKIRDFAQHVVSITAQSEGREIGLEKADKQTWVAAPCDAPLTVTATIYAHDRSVRGAHFDTTHLYFNGPCVFLSVIGQEDNVCEVVIEAPEEPVGKDWRVVTSMRSSSAEQYGFGTYAAENYDELIDHPVEIGTLQIGEFDVRDIPHVLAIRGTARIDMGRICTDLAVLCEEHMKLFGVPADLDRYVFMLDLQAKGYGGLEHCWSSSLASSRGDLPSREESGVSKNYRKFLGLCSHEYFHLWNVKRMRPAALRPYELSDESYTGLLWVFEGITSYYDDLALVRSGLIGVKSYLELLGKTMTRVLRGSGRQIQSVEESSFDAWTKFYNQGDNAANAIVSYYAKGSLIALALDLTLRSKSDVSLDDVMRECWARYGETGEGMPERGIESIVSELSGLDLEEFFARYVRGTTDLPLAAYLSDFGVTMHMRCRQGRTDAGGKRGNADRELPVWFGASLLGGTNGDTFRRIEAGSPAEQAGLSAGDVAIAMNGLKLTAANFEKRLREQHAGNRATLLVFRDDELVNLKLRFKKPREDTCYLEVEQDCTEEAAERRVAWLGSE